MQRRLIINTLPPALVPCVKKVVPEPGGRAFVQLHTAERAQEMTGCMCSVCYIAWLSSSCQGVSSAYGGMATTCPDVVVSGLAGSFCLRYCFKACCSRGRCGGAWGAGRGPGAGSAGRGHLIRVLIYEKDAAQTNSYELVATRVLLLLSVSCVVVFASGAL